MSPVMRMKQDATADLALLPPGITAAEIAHNAKKQLKEGLESLAEQQRARTMEMAEQYRVSIRSICKHSREQLERQLKQLKERSSPKAKKDAEAERKKAIGSARRAAEYDIYKGIMAMAALGNEPLDKCHKRAQAFAEHVVKWSPAGHGDNAYVGIAAYES